MSSRKVSRLIPSLLFLALTILPARATAGPPTDELRHSVDGIMRLLNGHELAKPERNRRILDLMRERFSFPIMSQWILGVYWRKASPEQRDRFIDLFTHLLESTYKSRIEAYADQYSDETVEYTSERIKGDKALVTTLIHTRNKAIPVDYKLVSTPAGWMIYDVVIEEVSLVRNYRTTYDEIVRGEGFDGLFSRMEEKIAQLDSAPAGSETKP